MCMSVGVHEKVRGHPGGARYLFLLCEFQESNSYHWTWRQMPLPAEPSCWLFFVVLNGRDTEHEVIFFSKFYMYTSMQHLNTGWKTGCKRALYIKFTGHAESHTVFYEVNPILYGTATSPPSLEEPLCCSLFTRAPHSSVLTLTWKGYL